MPLKRSSDQPSRTLQEFYTELRENKDSYENKIGEAALAFIELVNQTFIQTEIWVWTSHYSLVLSDKDDWEAGWFVGVDCAALHEYRLRYQIPEQRSPWPDAMVEGVANTVEKAKDYLIIAMVESGGWPTSNELRQLYKGQHRFRL